jgi:hypothetical protein
MKCDHFHPTRPQADDGCVAKTKHRPFNHPEFTAMNTEIPTPEEKAQKSPDRYT